MIGFRNENGFEQWYVENTFDYPNNPLGSRDCSLMRKAWHAALDSRHTPEPQGEAVADPPFGWWIECNGTDGDFGQFVIDYHFLELLKSHGVVCDVTPLYTRPQPGEEPIKAFKGFRFVVNPNIPDNELRVIDANGRVLGALVNLEEPQPGEGGGEVSSIIETMLCAAGLLEHSQSIVDRREAGALRTAAQQLRALSKGGQGGLG